VDVYLIGLALGHIHRKELLRSKQPKILTAQIVLPREIKVSSTELIAVIDYINGNRFA
jgi:hypothetical protein